MSTDFQDQDLGDAWECPTCLQPFPPHHDYECGTCEMPASHHHSVTTLCKLMRETHTRELCLIAENNRLKTQIEDAETTAGLWMNHAKQADECGADLKAELADTRREWKQELAAERALADRLAEAFKDLWDNHTMYGAGYEVVEKALAAWKEARSE